MPYWAPRPVPTMMAVGVANPKAQGQAMTSTAVAVINEVVNPASPMKYQPRNVSRAMPITAGTKMAETRSASFWMGAFDPCASSTMRIIWASAVSLPTRVAWMRNMPCLLIVAPIT